MISALIKRAWFVTRRIALACAALSLVAACQKSSNTESTLGYELPDRNETHAIFTFAELPANGSFAGRAAMTLRIPREYVWFSNVLSKNGKVEQVPIRIELPGPVVPRDHPELNAKKGTPEHDGFMKNRLGRFIVDIGSGSGDGGRNRFLYGLQSGSTKQDGSDGSMVYDGEVYGLVRYSPFRCYFAKDLEEPYSKKFIESKPADDPRPELNCRLNRGSSIYFSPPSVTSPDEVVFIECDSVIRNCHASFDMSRKGIVGQYGMNTTINDALLFRWAEIIGPARELVRSFVIVHTSNASASTPR